MQHKRLDFLAALSGLMIALQARANGELSHRLDNGLQAAVISFGSGLIIITVIALFNPSIKEGIRTLRGAVRAKAIPTWTLFAGMLGGSFVAVQTQIVPLIGVAIYSVASIAGQSAISLVVDRIGLTGGGKKAITPRRITAAFVTVFAVFISVADRLDGRNLSIAAVLFGVLAGAIVGVLLIDLFSPTDGVQVSVYLVSGIVLTYLGVLVGGVRNSQLKRAAREK